MAQPSRLLPPLGSAQDDPYGPAARVDDLRGLDRLRGVADRNLAEHLYLLYVRAERNSTQPPAEQSTGAITFEALRRVASRAIAGDFGANARELAEYLLLDDNGQRREDEPSLKAFGVSFRRLRNGS